MLILRYLSVCFTLFRFLYKHTYSSEIHTICNPNSWQISFLCFIVNCFITTYIYFYLFVCCLFFFRTITLRGLFLFFFSFLFVSFLFFLFFSLAYSLVCCAWHTICIQQILIEYFIPSQQGPFFI